MVNDIKPKLGLLASHGKHT